MRLGSDGRLIEGAADVACDVLESRELRDEGRGGIEGYAWATNTKPSKMQQTICH